MSRQGDDRDPHLTSGDSGLFRSNIPAYSLVGFACAAVHDEITVTMGLVTNTAYPESRPIRVLISREACSELGAALARLTVAQCAQ